VRALGVDPGLTATGYGVIESDGERFSVLVAGTERPLKDAPLPERLASVHGCVCQVVEAFRPDVIAVEEVFLARNLPSAMLTAQVLGVVKLAAVGCRLRSYAPREIKKWVCGTGSAPKEQMMGMMGHLLGGYVTPSDHAADALAVALCALMDGRP